jgi:hypothetical protein
MTCDHAGVPARRNDVGEWASASLNDRTAPGLAFSVIAVVPGGAACRLRSRSLLTYLGDVVAAESRGDPFSALAA